MIKNILETSTVWSPRGVTTGSRQRLKWLKLTAWIKKRKRPERLPANDRFYLNRDVISNFLTLVNEFKNIRVAISACLDWNMMTEALDENLDAPRSEKEIFFQEYFSGACAGKIKAALIKNHHLEDEYFQYRSEYKTWEEKQLGMPPLIKNTYLKTLSTIKLSEHDSCCQGKLYLSEANEMYLKDKNNLFEQIWVELSFIGWLFTGLQKNIELEISVPTKNNFIDVKNGFMKIFKRIELFSTGESNINNYKETILKIFLFYKIFDVEYSLGIDKEEKNLVSQIENYLSIERIKISLENIIKMKMVPHEWSFPLRKKIVNIDSLQKILETYEKNT